MVIDRVKLLLCFFVLFALAACARFEETETEPELPTPEFTKTAVSIPTNTPQLPATPTATSQPALAEQLPALHPVLPLAGYPPSNTPYRIEGGDFWLVHTPEGQLMAFAPFSPSYADHVSVDECRYAWAEANNRFADPCSGDEWELNGRLNLEHSGELWSNRNLDQYHLSVIEGQIFVQFDRVYHSLAVNESPLATNSQFGVTMTVATADFGPTATDIITLTQVDPVWGMNPTAFPPQQALTYVTFPDSLFDDQGRNYAPVGGQGGLAVFDPSTDGMQQNYYLQWEPVLADATVVTATLTTDLSNIYREISFQPGWENHQEGDAWAVDIPLEISHVAARITELKWISSTPDGRIRLRLTVEDESPEALNLYCLHLDTEDPWQRTCANFEGELDYIVIVPAEEPVTLHLRAGVELVTPFLFVLPVDSPESAAYDVPALDTWLPYEDAALGLALRYPPDWTITERNNGLTLTAPQTTVIDSETIPWTIHVSVHPKFAADAALFDVIVNEYHFPDVMEQFEETLIEENINGRTAYRSTIIPAIGGQQSVFFEDGDRFVEVTLRPFDAERPYKNQELFAELFTTFLETLTFSQE